jgi:hypothetical protein
MKLKNLIVLLIAIFVLIVFVSIFVYNNFLIKEVRLVPADFNVTVHSGLVGDVDALHFGSIQANGESYRDMHIEAEEDAFVVIKVRGEIKEFLSADQPHFFIKGGSKQTIQFRLDVPRGTSFGARTGVVYFYFLDPAARYFVIN